MRTMALCGVMMLGSLRVAQDATPGKATMVVELPETSAFASFATELPVVIE